MKVADVFADIRHRTFILWITDLGIGILSYFYLTNPAYLHKAIIEMQNSGLETTPEMEEMFSHTMNITILMTIACFVLLHSYIFYKYYRQKKAAQAYITVYCFLAALSLGLWLVSDFRLLNLWMIVPIAIYGYIFRLERRKKQFTAN